MQTANSREKPSKGNDNSIIILLNGQILIEFVIFYIYYLRIVIKDQSKRYQIIFCVKYVVYVFLICLFFPQGLCQTGLCLGIGRGRGNIRQQNRKKKNITVIVTSSHKHSCHHTWCPTKKTIENKSVNFVFTIQNNNIFVRYKPI